MRILITRAVFAEAREPESNESFELLIPDIHVEKRPLDSDVSQRLLGKRRLIKSHTLEGFEAHRMVYVFRRPEDSLISAYFQAMGRPESQERVQQKGPDRYCIDRMPLWNAHMELALSLDCDDQVYMAAYEDMKRDTQAVLGPVLAFLGLTVSAANIAQAVKETEFSKLQKQYPSETRPMFRKGIIGDAKNHLKEETLAKIESESGGLYNAACAKLRYSL